MADWMDALSESFEWGQMGKQEAATKIVSGEIERGVSREKRELMKHDKDYKSFYSNIDKAHEGKHGTKFFGGKDKQLLKNAVMKFHGASMAMSQAGSIVLNDRVAAAMDAWNMGEEDINNALMGYSNEITATGQALLNSIGVSTRKSNGALSTSAGGPMTPEETEFVLEMLGTWNPEARNALEMDNKKGIFLNNVTEAYGDILDPSNIETWGDGDPRLSKLTTQDKNHILSGLHTFGEERRAKALEAKWAGDEQYINQINQDWYNDILNCVRVNQGIGKNPDGSERTIDTPKWTTVKKTKKTATDLGSDTQEDYSAMEGTIQQNLDIDLPTAAGCLSSTAHPFGEGSPAKWGVAMARNFGLNRTHFLNNDRAKRVHNEIYGEGGFLPMLQSMYSMSREAELPGRPRLTGVMIPNELKKQIPGLPSYVTLEPRDMPILMRVFEHFDETGTNPTFVTGDGGNYKRSNFGLKRPDGSSLSMRQALIDSGLFSKGADYVEGEDEDPAYLWGANGSTQATTFFRSGYAPFMRELQEMTTNPDWRLAIDSKMASWNNPGTTNYNTDIIMELTGRGREKTPWSTAVGNPLLAGEGEY